jgi:hypothetical protein
VKKSSFVDGREAASHNPVPGKTPDHHLFHRHFREKIQPSGHFILPARAAGPSL